jgi:energy-converting hydrogenase Eha subunit A
MKPTFNDKLIAYLVLFSGLAISAVAEYYSIMGLMAIYPAAIIPIVIMGVVLGIGKISGTVWLKQNWEWSPFFLKAYVLPAIVVLMLITSLGVFGFLSKAHSDQSLVSGDVAAKIAVYDEKIRIAKDNIDANRKALKQMDEAVDQVMGRSSDEKGADKAVGIRRAQQKERVRLQSEIAAEQKTIASISEERAPVAAEVRKVDAEVGPIKYIAHLLYGENPDANILEKAVIWVTVLIVIVLDPLAVVLLLASQYSFQRFREIEEKEKTDWIDDQVDELNDSNFVADEILKAGVTNSNPDDNIPIVEELKEGDSPRVEEAVVDTEPTTVTTSTIEYKFLDEVTIPEYTEDFLVENKADDTSPNFEGVKVDGEWVQTGPEFGRSEITVDWESIPPEQEYIVIDGQNMHVKAAKAFYKQTPKVSGYVQNEEQSEGTKWNRVISEAEYRDKINNANKNNPSNAT